jgi:hypothetical protein
MTPSEIPPRLVPVGKQVLLTKRRAVDLCRVATCLCQMS